jgi:hypothetical protein
LETAFQKPLSPLSVLLATSAATGSSTVTLSQTSEIDSSGGLGLIDATLRNGSEPFRRVPAPPLLGSRDANRLLDLCHDA